MLLSESERSRMRAIGGGNFTMQQGLTQEAAIVVKQALTLARRRGHAQVTPLHVAHTMLSTTPSGLFRTACVQSHSHPLQCRALELCFNVALNRLPASTTSSSPMLLGGGGPQFPSISNALVAAFKRAQAHQRRGTIENQQQALLVVKIEIEQLIISILDDPSVSRVMREASFSSTQVKTNVEQIVSLELCSQNPNSGTTGKSRESNLVRDHPPIKFPADTLSLSLNFHSTNSENRSKNKKDGYGSSWFSKHGDTKNHTCCSTEYCSVNSDMENRSLQSPNTTTTSSLLPSWLQQYKDENQKRTSSNDKECIPVKGLGKKWNTICNSFHKQQPHSSSDKTLITFSSLSPSSSTSGFSYDRNNPNMHKKSWNNNDHHFMITEAFNKTIEPNLRHYIPFTPNPSSTPNSGSSSEIMEMEQYNPRFMEFNDENLKTVSSALENKVPWQKNIIPEIATTILQCRSGNVKRKEKWLKMTIKNETWLFFQGADVEGKEKIARELAKLIFGSKTNFTTIALSSFSSTRADSTEDLRNSFKRLRDEQSCSYIGRFTEAISISPHRVFLLEDIEQADFCSQMGIKRAIERGKVTNSDGDEVSLEDAIVILSCETFSSRSRACSPPTKQKSDDSQETSPCVSLDLNISIDDDGVEDQSIDDIGLLESVDRRIGFKIIEL